jgi:hypothetical protein
MIESLVGSFGGPVLEDLGKRIGLPAEVVKQATPLVTGLVVASVGRMLKQPGGADAVTGLFKSAGDLMGGGDLDAFVKSADPAKSADMLKMLAGSNSVENITGNLAKKTGLDADAIGKMMGVMAPAVLGGLGKMAKEQGLDAAGVGKLIEDNADALAGIGDLDTLMDNVPGISDDLKRGISKLFGG